MTTPQTARRALAVLLSLALTAMTAGAQWDAESLQSAFDDFADDCERDGGALWGVSLAGPVLLVDPDQREVFGNRADAEERLIAIGGLHAGRVGERFPMANSSHTWAGVEWATVMLPLPSDASLRRALLLHESFHRVQDELGFVMSSADNGHLDEQQPRVALRAELRAWARALARTDERWHDAVRDALAFRERRYTRPQIESAEVALERHEGLAEYTGLRLADADTAEVERRVIAMLAAFETRPSFVRSFAYATGPALGLVLDRLDETWRDKVRRGAALHDLVAAALPLENQPVISGHEARDALYDVAQIEAEEAARDEQRRHRIAADRARFIDGPVVSIPLLAMQMTFDPNRVRPFDGHGTIYETITLVDAWGQLAVEAGGALLASTFDRATVVGVSGDVVESALAALNETRTFTGEGWTLELASGWRAVGDARGRIEIKRVE